MSGGSALAVTRRAGEKCVERDFEEDPGSVCECSVGREAGGIEAREFSRALGEDSGEGRNKGAFEVEEGDHVDYHHERTEGNDRAGAEGYGPGADVEAAPLRVDVRFCRSGRRGGGRLAAMDGRHGGEIAC